MNNSVVAILTLIGVILGLLLAHAIMYFSGAYEKLTYTHDKLKEWEFNCVK